MKKIAGTFLFILLSVGTAFGAPQDTLVIAQGVDATTLDPQNHSAPRVCEERGLR